MRSEVLGGRDFIRFVCVFAVYLTFQRCPAVHGGSVVGWGWDICGQATPPADTDFIAIAGGGYHSLVLKSDGSLIAWGGSEGAKNVPSGNDFVAISSGEEHNLTLRSNGSLVA